MFRSQNLQIGVTELINQIPASNAPFAFASAKAIKHAPVKAGPTKHRVEKERGTFHSTKYVAAKHETKLTTPLGMLSRAACCGVYPNPEIIVELKVAMAPLWMEQKAARKKASQMERSVVRVVRTCLKLNLRLTTLYLFTERRRAVK